MIDAIVLFCWALLLYAWLGYPLILRFVSRRASRLSRSEEGVPLPSPTIAILLSAHNEEHHIGDRIKNLAALDGPAGKATVRVGADGCTDKSVTIVETYAAECANVEILNIPDRRGKAAMLKDLVARSHEDVLVLTDANTEFRPDAVQKLVQHLDDSRVGGVCGRLVLVPHKNASADAPPPPHLPAPTHISPSPEGTYWRWETRLKEMESRLDSCLGANGAIYAIRRDLFWAELPDNTIIDDFVIGMKVREQGFRMVYEPQALAYEALPEQAIHEWGRRTRIGAGGYQALSLCRTCLFPRYGKFAWAFWSHKVLRWFTPHLMLLLLAAGWLSVSVSAQVVPSGVPALPRLLTPALLTVLLVAWALGGMLRRFSLCPRPLRLVDHFLSMQAALFAGFLRFCRGNLKGHWVHTPRG